MEDVNFGNDLVLLRGGEQHNEAQGVNPNGARTPRTGSRDGQR